MSRPGERARGVSRESARSGWEGSRARARGARRESRLGRARRVALARRGEGGEIESGASGGASRAGGEIWRGREGGGVRARRRARGRVWARSPALSSARRAGVARGFWPSPREPRADNTTTFVLQYIFTRNRSGIYTFKRRALSFARRGCARASKCCLVICHHRNRSEGYSMRSRDATHGEAHGKTSKTRGSRAKRGWPRLRSTR